MRYKIYILLVLLSTSSFGADIPGRIKTALAFQKKYFLSQKVPGKMPPCLTDEGRFKLTNAGDMFSVMMDTWGLKVLQAKTADEVIAQLPVITRWAETKGEAAENMLKAVSAVLADLPEQKKIKYSKVEGELRYGLALASRGKPDELNGGLKRLEDISRWMVLECQWLEKLCSLIKEHEAQFRKDWSKALVNGAVFGASLTQRMYDLAEIQVLFEDIILLDKAEIEIFKKYQDLPSVLSPGARPVYAVLKAGLSKKTADLMDQHMSSEYEISFLNTQFRRYATAEGGAEVNGKNLAEALNKYTRRNKEIKQRHFSDIIDYRQGYISNGFQPASRFNPAILSLYIPVEDESITEAGKKVCTAVSAFFKQGLKWGGTTDIQDALTRKKSDETRLCNISGAILSANGYRGIYPVRIKGYWSLGLFNGEKVQVGDPFRGTGPGPLFPEYYSNRDIESVAFYLRTIGGYIAYNTLVNKETGVVRIEIPYLK